MKRRISSFGAMIVGLFGMLVTMPADAVVAPVNATFEGAFVPVRVADRKTVGRVRGQLPVEWQDNSTWADVDVTYSAASGEGVGGSRALRIEVGKCDSGRVQLVNRSVAPRPGQVIRLSLALRSPQPISIQVLFRQVGPPYRTYWSRTLEARPRWQSRTFEFPVRFDDPDSYLMFAVGSPGVLYLDNVRVEVRSLEEWAAARMSKRKNLLPNARFPLGLTNGWCISHRGRMLNSAAADPDWPGPSKGASLRVVARNEKAILYSPPFAVLPDKELVLSFWASCDEPKTPLSVGVIGAKESGKFTLERRWQRFNLRFRPTTESGATVMLSFATPGTVWLDGVQVERGQVASAFFDDVPELHLRPRGFMGLQTVTEKQVAAGAVPPFRLLATLLGAPPPGARVRLTETDVFGATRTFRSIPVAQLRGRTVELPIPPRPTAPMGSFRVTAELVGPKGLPLGAVAETVIHRIYEPVRFRRLTPSSPFGVHVSPTERQCRMAALLGFKWVRVHDAASWLTKWCYIEPEKGKWLWHDAEIDTYRKYGLSVLGMLGTAPPWASVRPKDGATGYWEGYYLPRDIKAWRNYVRKTVRHYRRKVRYWEVWNEPYGGFFRAGEKDGKPVHGTADQYMALLGAAYLEAHKAARGVTVLGPCTAGGKWSRECLQRGLLNSIDVFSYHQYTGSMLGRPGDAKERKLQEAVLIQKDFGEPKPVWNTEGGFGGSGMLHFYDSKLIPVAPTRDAVDAAAGIVRYYVAELAGGSERFFLYTMHGFGTFLGRSWSVLSADGSVHPVGAAVSHLAMRIEGSRFKERVEVRPGLFAHLFARRARSGVIVLLPCDSSPADLLAWPDGKAFDLMGNPLALPLRVSNLPVYLTWRGDPEVALQALRLPAVWKAAPGADSR
ncbi:MAG: hypothetical protein GXP31_06165 [Kiritimatiellaeota bacterium]|nr:hypothetical protein [Kiritimatiellota bacterium]